MVEGTAANVEHSENIIETGTYLILNSYSMNCAAMMEQREGVPVSARTDGFQNASLTQWEVHRHRNGRHHIKNIGTSLYARHPFRTSARNAVEGSTSPQLWHIRETRVQNTYSIITTYRDYFWGLEDKELDTTVTLYDHYASPYTTWEFIAVKPEPPLPEPPGPVHVSGTIAIRNHVNRYLRVLSNKGLAFNGTMTDDNALFHVRPLGGKIALIGSNGQHVNMYYVDDVKCEGPGGGLSLGVEHRPGGLVSFTISGYQGQDGKTFYLSSDPGNAPYNGSIAVKRAENDSCRFSIENISYKSPQAAAMNGVVALRNNFGLYMKITSEHGLIFNSPVLDDDARFIVQQRGDKIALIGNNGSHLNMYSGWYVKSHGPGGGVVFGVASRSAWTICLTVSGYSGQDGQTFYLSSKQGSGGYGTLAVSRSEDESCIFTLENLS